MDKPKILLIDDDQTLTDMYQFKFDHDGKCQLVIANGPSEGIKKAKADKPDLILLDLILPKRMGYPESLDKETGFGVLESLKSDPDTKNTRVIIFTNLDEDLNDNSGGAKFLGAKDYWVKANYKPAEVVEKVKKIVK